tara:strand:+ start:66 stop:2030 length:1965 start_codon:yes stop_codon:yes gene_type:complete
MAAETYILNFEANTTKAVKSVDKLDKSLVKTTKDSGNLNGAVSGLDGATGGLITKFKGLGVGLKGITSGFKTMRLAVISTGIGALVLGIAALGAAFTGNEEGQNKFAKILSVIGALTGNLVDLLADLGEAIIKTFENPKESLEAFSKAIKDGITTSLKGILNLIPNLAKAVDQLFKGNFREAGKIAIDSVGKIALGVDSITDSTNRAAAALEKFGKEQIKEAKLAASVADMRAKADIIDRELVEERSVLESKIALLRLKSRQEDQFTATERKQALLDAQVLEDQLLDKETEFLELRRDAQVLENTFSRSNKENLMKEAEAIAAVNRQQASRANVARQVQREVNTISKQIEGEEKVAANALANFKKTLRDAEAATLQEKRDLELIKIREQFALLREEAILNNVAVDELDAARDIVLQEKQAAFDLADQAARDKTIADAKVVSDEVNRIADEQLAADEAIALKKKGIRDKAFADAVTIAGAESKLGKAIIIAKQLLLAKEMIMEIKAAISLAQIESTKTTIKATSAGADISTGAAKAVSSAPPPFNVPSILAYAAQAIGIVSSIRSAVKASKAATSSLGATGGSVNIADVSTSVGSAVPEQAAQTPDFDILGATGGNQLASALGQQAPIQAFVVSQDVTTAQSLQNNIIQGATLGG